MTRVGLVIGQLTVGGAEGQLAELVRGLDRALTPVVYSLASGHDSLVTRLEATGAQLRFIEGGGLTRARRLAAALSADRIDIIHSWLFIANAYAAATRLFGCRVPLITSARNCKIQSRASQIANAVAFRLSRAIVVNSADVERFIAKNYGAPRERIRVIHNGVDTDRFRPAESTPPAPTVITVGRLVQQKNHELFLRAAAALSRSHPDCRFVIVGAGPLESELKRLARELAIAERVTFAGERQDVDQLLRSATLFWLTSRWEGMPNAVLEALASGLPVIATDVGGVRDLVRDGREGFVVASGSVDDIARQSARLLDDTGQWCAAAKNARARAEEFSIAAMAGALSRLYQDLMLPHPNPLPQ